jgi:CAAX prenyl protease-like protein
MTTATDSPPETRTALPYVVPMLGFVALTAAEGWIAGEWGASRPIVYPVAYTFKIAIVACLAWRFRAAWRDLAPRPGALGLALAALLGLVVAALWVGLDGLYPELGFLGKRTAFDPNVLSPAVRWAFLTVRMLGLVLIVPLIEELFWRSFVMRYAIDPDFARVPIGRVTPLAAAITSVGFGFTHPEWLPAVLTGLAWAGLLARTRSVLACVVSHSAANLALGIYVIVCHDWKFW